jgi:hypothetical protein
MHLPLAVQNAGKSTEAQSASVTGGRVNDLLEFTPVLVAGGAATIPADGAAFECRGHAVVTNSTSPDATGCHDKGRCKPKIFTGQHVVDQTTRVVTSAS